ncbi:MAG: hypothetical protein ACYCZX_01310 [Rhodospirillaceae bacterium]
MITRTLRSSVEFKRPFKLPHIDGLQPPGIYQVETEEERLDSMTVDAFRRLATRLYLMADPRTPGVREEVVVNPDDLDAALARDRAGA